MKSSVHVYTDDITIHVSASEFKGKLHFTVYATATSFTSTRSPIFSSLSPFLTDPVSERLETDSLLVRVRFEVAVAGVVAGAFLAAVALEDGADFVAGVCEATLPTEGVGDAAREGGAV